MQPKIEGVLLETVQEAAVLNPLAGRQKGDTTPGLLLRAEASMAYAKLDQQWQRLANGAQRDMQHNLAQELGITIIRSGDLRHEAAMSAQNENVAQIGALATVQEASLQGMPQVA